MTNQEAYTALMAQALKHGFTMDEWDNAVILSWGFDDVSEYEGEEHLDFAIGELREMKMQPSLERALRHRGLLKA